MRSRSGGNFWWRRRPARGVGHYGDASLADLSRAANQPEAGSPARSQGLDVRFERATLTQAEQVILRSAVELLCRHGAVVVHTDRGGITARLHEDTLELTRPGHRTAIIGMNPGLDEAQGRVELQTRLTNAILSAAPNNYVRSVAPASST